MANVNDKISSFVRLYFPAAVKCFRETKIPVMFTLAQAGLESDWGNRAKENNFFGVTAGASWKGKTQVIRTKETLPSNDLKKYKFVKVHSITSHKTDKGEVFYIWDIDRLFRAYDTAAEGFADHAEVLQLGIYKKAFKHTDAKLFAEEIAAAGYATSRDYAKILKDCIDSVAVRMKLLGLQLP
jgi:flagellar protein FlgJ